MGAHGTQQMQNRNSAARGGWSPRAEHTSCVLGQRRRAWVLPARSCGFSLSLSLLLLPPPTLNAPVLKSTGFCHEETRPSPCLHVKNAATHGLKTSPHPCLRPRLAPQCTWHRTHRFPGSHLPMPPGPLSLGLLPSPTLISFLWLQTPSSFQPQGLCAGGCPA